MDLDERLAGARLRVGALLDDDLTVFDDDCAHMLFS